MPTFREVETDGRVVVGRRARTDGHDEPTAREPIDRAKVLATGTGPRTTASETVVASVISPECSITAASATGPSSQGTEKTMWSFTDSAPKPSCAAVLVYATR